MTLTLVEARERAALLRIESYDVAIDVTGDGDTFRSRTTITFGCTEPGASSFVDAVAETFREVRLNGTLVEPPDGNRLSLTGLAARNTLVVDGDFRYSNSAEGLHRFVDPVDGAVYLYSMTCIAESRRMYACFDQPDLKASFTFHVTVPDGWQVVSNAPVATSSSTVHFEPTPPISTYIAGIAAGPYHRVTDTTGSIPLGLYCRASLASSLDAAELFAITKEGLDFYTRAFGHPYPFAKLDQIFVPEFHADGMENAAAILYKDEFVYTSRVSEEERELRTYTILHEIAHMWFGDLVTARWWDDLWLNEAFATFVSFLARSAWTMFVQQVKSFAYVQDQLPTTHPITADIPDVAAAEVNFDGISYEKGASVLRQLLAYVGEPEFLTALSGYFRQHEYRNTTLTDLLDALAKGSGRDLTAWSAEWLETAGVNTLRAEYTVDSLGAFTSFAVAQTAPEDHPTLRTHRLAIGLYSSVAGKLERVHRVETDVSGARTEIPALLGHTSPDLVLVNDDDLTYAKIRLDPHSLDTMLTRTGDITSALPRTLCWTTAWDMTRLGELPAHSYVDLVLAGIDAETEFGVFAALLDNVDKALRHYSAPHRATEGWARLAEAAWAGMTNAEPGGDRQLVWFHTFTRAVGDLVDRLRGLYDGAITVVGLTLDTDARWRMLHGLIAYGRATDEDIAAELARDNSSTAARLADTARALLPSPAAKAEAWAMATDDGERPGQVRMAYVAGFWHHTQTELLEPYGARYFAELDEIWTRHEGGLNAVHLSYRLFPDIVSRSTVDAADKWLSRDDTPPAQRRLVLERRDEIARALANRTRDSG
jgi:aminopeptidase N